MSQCQADGGLLLFEEKPGVPVYPLASSTSEGSLSSAKEDLPIGRLSFTQSGRAGCLELNESLESPTPTSNRADLRRRWTTSGRRTPVTATPSSLETNPFVETRKRTGIKSGCRPLTERFMKSLPTYEFVVILPSEESTRTIACQLRWSGVYQFSGAKLVRVKVEELGKKPVWELIVKTQIPSGGTDTEIRSMLLSMNFEEESIYLMFSGGSIGTRSVWRPREQVNPYL